jgi:putative peptidoglycan lipid II flippase
MGTLLGYIAAVMLPPMLDLDPRWGAAGLTAAGSAAGWTEFLLLRGSLRRRIGDVTPPAAYTVTLWSVALGSSALSRLVYGWLPPHHPLVAGVVVLPFFALLFLAGTQALGLPFGGKDAGSS